ncbi:hypothetical protein GOBAR_AA16159 [Gossypium barbadense]|uniref:Uncharacterized protein n=1 Tax=Gossypium barbadense TaxID=3634 RepID=A0A2P5XMC0_GOSBA|nr:hypothetical protein GOBAR_AA16159 [Gossypium barbadense]
MKMKGWAIKQWKGYFHTNNYSDIFDKLDHAIMVAALACPKEFKLRRDRIIEKQFTCKLTRCSSSDQVKLVLLEYVDDDNPTGCHESFKRETNEE